MKKVIFFCIFLLGFTFFRFQPEDMDASVFPDDYVPIFSAEGYCFINLGTIRPRTFAIEVSRKNFITIVNTDASGLIETFYFWDGRHFRIKFDRDEIINGLTNIQSSIKRQDKLFCDRSNNAFTGVIRIPYSALQNNPSGISEVVFKAGVIWRVKECDAKDQEIYSFDMDEIIYLHNTFGRVMKTYVPASTPGALAPFFTQTPLPHYKILTDKEKERELRKNFRSYFL